MHRPSVRRRGHASLHAAALCLALVAACTGGAPARDDRAVISKGVYGAYYYVNVSRPVGGTITSDDGRIA